MISPPKIIFLIIFGGLSDFTIEKFCKMPYNIVKIKKGEGLWQKNTIGK